MLAGSVSPLSTLYSLPLSAASRLLPAAASHHASDSLASQERAFTEAEDSFLPPQHVHHHCPLPPSLLVSVLAWLGNQH